MAKRGDNVSQSRRMWRQAPGNSIRLEVIAESFQQRRFTGAAGTVENQMGACLQARAEMGAILLKIPIERRNMLMKPAPHAQKLIQLSIEHNSVGLRCARGTIGIVH